MTTDQLEVLAADVQAHGDRAAVGRLRDHALLQIAIALSTIAEELSTIRHEGIPPYVVQG